MISRFFFISLFFINSFVFGINAPDSMEKFNIICPSDTLCPKLDSFFVDCKNLKTNCENYVSVFRNLLPIYDCQRPYDNVSKNINYIVPAFWLCNEEKGEEFIDLLLELDSENSLNLFASEDFRKILDGIYAEQYYEHSLYIQDSLKNKDKKIKILNARQESDDKYCDFEDLDENGKPIGNIVFLKGCSWYCGGSVKEIYASSELQSQGKNTYSAKNAHDFKFETAWVEGKKDYGIGEYLEYKFNFDHIKNYKGTLGVTRIILANGYKKNKTLWEQNSRVKKMEMFVNDKPYAILNLLDSYELQIINIGNIPFPAKEVTTFKFRISEVYKGKKYKDTAISELVFEGVGVH